MRAMLTIISGNLHSLATSFQDHSNKWTWTLVRGSGIGRLLEKKHAGRLLSVQQQFLASQLALPGGLNRPARGPMPLLTSANNCTSAVLLAGSWLPVALASYCVKCFATDLLMEDMLAHHSRLYRKKMNTVARLAADGEICGLKTGCQRVSSLHRHVGVSTIPWLVL